MFDLCFVLYNSEKWLKACVESFTKVNYDKKKLALYFADNQSTDNTLTVLEGLKKQYGAEFAKFEILPQKVNGGFGKGSNAAARQGTGDYVFFCNVDTEIHPDAFTNLEKAITNASEEFRAFELRQFPYEHPKYYDPVTMEVSWASGACFVLRRDIFEKTGGFDESIFMYAEDVDLSWHIRALGYKIMYVPSAILHHYAYQSAGEEKPMQLVGSIAGNLVLRYKYGNHDEVNDWARLYQLVKARVESREAIHQALLKQLKRIRALHKSYRKFYHQTVENSEFEPSFLEFDYEFARNGAFYESHLPKKRPEITVIVRTYRRPNLLAMTLESLCNQTYQNFRVLVVEDGVTSMSKSTVEKYRSRLNIGYHPLCAAKGRCKAGNIGLEHAKTEYVCFLDDDDYFFAEHLEVMACLIEENPDCGMFVASSVLGKCKVKKSDPTEFQYTEKHNHGKEIRLVDFFAGNPIPIQAAVFKRELYEKYGGFDESLDALEDWDLWMRYLTHTKFAYAEKATSIFKVPAQAEDVAERDRFISSYRKKVFSKMRNYGGYVAACDIYGFFWKPAEDTAESLFVPEQKTGGTQKKVLSHKEHMKMLRASVEEIQNSKTWKIILPVRAVTWVVRTLFGGILRTLLAVFDRLSRILYKLWLGVHKMCDKVAPSSINTKKATEQQLQSFFFLSRQCLCWKLLHRGSRKEP